jgi:hypothetical protein
MPSAWLRRKALQPWDGGRLRRAMYLATLVCPISMPSLRSSPWIRGAPHSGFARLISRINRRISGRYLRPSCARSRFPAPVGSEPCAVPTEHGVGLDDRQRVANIGEEPTEANEYQAIYAAEAKPPRGRPPQHIDLVAQHQVFRIEPPSAEAPTRSLCKGHTSDHSIAHFATTC